jgi:hypothetical protein
MNKPNFFFVRSQWAINKIGHPGPRIACTVSSANSTVVQIQTIKNLSEATFSLLIMSYSIPATGNFGSCGAVAQDAFCCI